MPTLTIKRALPEDEIRVPLFIFDVGITKETKAFGLFDTGNDHTVLSKAVVDTVGGTYTGRMLPVHGVTGSGTARTAQVTLGIEFDDGHRIMINDHEVAVLDETDNHALLGRDFLQRFDVTISRDGTFTLSV
jgi:predicted aspartyl protease